MHRVPCMTDHAAAVQCRGIVVPASKQLRRHGVCRCRRDVSANGKAWRVGCDGRVQTASSDAGCAKFHGARTVKTAVIPHEAGEANN